MPKPAKVKILILKWVFTYKLDDKGYLVNYKARIYVRGDLQPHKEKTYIRQQVHIEHFLYIWLSSLHLI